MPLRSARSLQERLKKPFVLVLRRPFFERP